MINFGNLSIEGYCSINKFEINLTNGRVTIIRGRNGVGKSSFLSAMFWALYGKTLKDGVKNVNTWKKRQPKDYQGTMVSQYFEKNGKIHQVIRCSNYKGKVRGSAGKNRLIYVIDNEEVEEKKKGGIQAQIIADLGMSQYLFLNSIMFGQGLKRLVQTSSTDKNNLFEEIFNLSYISEARDLGKKEYTKLLDEYNSLSSKLSSSESLLIEYKKLSMEAKNSLENFQNSQKIALSNIMSKIKESTQMLSKIDTSKLKLHLAKANDEKAHLNEAINKAKQEYKIRLNSVDLSEPDILSHFIDDLIRLIDKNPKKAKEKLLGMKDSLNYINGYHKTIEQARSALIKASDKANNLSHEISKASQISSRLTQLRESLSEIKKNRPPKVKDSDHSSMVKKYQDDVNKLKEHISRLKGPLENYKWLINEALGNKGIKSYIFESSLNELNEHMKEYAHILGFQVEFSIDLSSASKSFYTLIELEGNIVDYEELSGGQQQLVHLAMAFATHTMSTTSMGINILFLDEIFENLDSENVDIVVSLIRKVSKGKSIYIITHKDSLPISNAMVLSLATEKGLTVFN